MSGLDVSRIVSDPAVIAHKLVHKRRFAEAVAAYDLILEHTPRADLWVNRGVALQALYKLPEALDSYGQAIACDATSYGAYVNRGIVFGWLGKYAEAIHEYSQALALEPTNESARLGRAVILHALGKLEESIADADEALALNMSSGDAHYNKGLSLLSLGNYPEGFMEHEWRFGTRAVLGPYRFKQPLWTGQQTDKRILVYCEQGLGDNLQFCRYLTRMKGLNLTLEAPRPLMRLLEQFGHPVIDRDAPQKPEFDLHCPMMSLGAVFGTTLETIPSTGGYLKADGSDWRKRLAGKSGLKVGVSWSSGVRFSFVIAMTMQRKKSIATADFAEVMDIPGVTFVSLQKEEPHDLGKIDLPNWYDPMPECNDLQATAELIDALDLVITVDSAVAHLAAALGKPVWVLNRFDICWRWLSGSVEAPWYDSAKIYRQHQPMDWSNVLASVKQDLVTLTRASLPRMYRGGPRTLKSFGDLATLQWNSMPTAPPAPISGAVT